MKHITYTPRGVCSRQIDIDIDDNDIILSAAFTGGCSGNTQGVCALISGMSAKEAIKRLTGIRCGFKSTSCPDQLSKALTEYLQNK